jgi:enoyl-CoA hydratase/carnithine racemase
MRQSDFAKGELISMDDHILFFRHDDVATITLNRVAKLNALDLAMCEALRARLVEARRDPGIRAVILTGNERAFCAGGDLQFALAANPQTPGDSSHGLSIPAGGSFTLPRLVGMARALEIVMLDESIPAGRALELGLANMVVPDAALLDEARKLASRVAKMPTSILGRVKRLMNDTFGSTLEKQLESERKEIAASADSLEGREGIYAFLEKRQPDFVAAGKGSFASGF